MRTPVTGILALATVTGLLAGCVDRGEILLSPSADPLPPFTLGADGSDAQPLANPHFTFLPPMAPPSEPNGEFDASLLDQLAVRVCVWDGTECTASVAEFTSQSEPHSQALRLSDDDEHYLVNWHMKNALSDYALTGGQYYRIGVLAGDKLLGYADMGPGHGGLVVTTTQVVLPVNPRRTLPIKFRIEVGALDYDGDPGGDPPPPPPAPVVTVSAGDNHVCGTLDGAAYCWGANYNGQLGIGTISATPEPTPQPVVGDHLFGQLSAGQDHNCGLDAQGQAFCWGAGGNGRLGDGMSMTQRAPVAVSGGHGFTTVRAAQQHTCGVVGGEVYCWGANRYGQLGQQPATMPMSGVPARVPLSAFALSVAVGGSTSCTLTEGGIAFCWGLNSNGQTGTNMTTSVLTQPTPVAGSLTFESLSVGATHACGVAAGGAAYCWGLNTGGQLGSGQISGNQREPLAVVDNHLFATLSAGTDFTCGLTPEGQGYCWGRNASGQLGAGWVSDYETRPQLVDGAHTFVSISAGKAFACGVTDGGEILCWGSNASGQLTDGSLPNSPSPMPALNPATP